MTVNHQNNRYAELASSLANHLKGCLTKDGTKSVSSIALARAEYYSVYTVPWRTETVLDILCSYGLQDRLKDLTVLDTGCGFGGMALYLGLETSASRVIALDVKERRLRVLEGIIHEFELHHISVLQADMHAIPIESKSVDLVIAYETMGYTSPPRDAIFRELYRVLSPDGSLILKEENLLFPLFALSRLPRLSSVFRGAATGVLGKESFAAQGWGKLNLISSFGSKVLLKDAGFKDVQLYSTTTREAKGLLRFLLPSFFVLGRK